MEFQGSDSSVGFVRSMLTSPYPCIATEPLSHTAWWLSGALLKPPNRLRSWDMWREKPESSI